MTPGEKIEALLEWLTWIAEGDDDYETAQRQVRNIIDPPKPKWRELTDNARCTADEEDGLSLTLLFLSQLAANPAVNDPSWCLARIVAICEVQVGDGWQADPTGWPMTPNLPTLLVYLTDRQGYAEPKWRCLGNAAAAWLRSLTNDGAA